MSMVCGLDLHRGQITFDALQLDAAHIRDSYIGFHIGSANLCIKWHSQHKVAIAIAQHERVTLLIVIANLAIALDADRCLIPALHTQVATDISNNDLRLFTGRKCLQHV